MDVQIAFVGSIPVLTLTGRFDGLGAEQFDNAAKAVDSRTPFWILDISAVGYISSIGLRSLGTLEKTLRARDGGLILVGATRFVRQVLEVTTFDRWLRSAATVAEAIDVARRGEAGPVAEHQVGDRLIRTRPLAGNTSTLEWWSASGNVAPDRLISTSLADLGFAFGIAGFGESAADARRSLGAFIGTPIFAGVLPDGADGVSDFVAGG